MRMADPTHVGEEIRKRTSSEKVFSKALVCLSLFANAAVAGTGDSLDGAGMNGSSPRYSRAGSTYLGPHSERAMARNDPADVQRAAEAVQRIGAQMSGNRWCE